MDLRDLYHEVIIDHNRDPRHHYALENASHQARGFNPLCGDKITVYLSIDKDVIQKASFVGCGCAISQASASLMVDGLIGKTVAEARTLFQQFHAMMMADNEAPLPAIDKLIALAGARAYPARVKCATLAWHTLDAALNRDDAVVKTE